MSADWENPGGLTSARGRSADSWVSRGDHVDWRIATEHYYWDRLEQAHDFAVRSGVGVVGQYSRWYRLIEAEYLTRVNSQIAEERPWLKVERIDAEVGHYRSVVDVIVLGCDEAARRLGYRHEAPTMISILGIQTDAPWTVGRFGYCIDKYPFDKICIPNQALRNPDELARVVAHEYAHVIALNVANGQAPRWLEEAISQVVEGQADLRARRAFASGQAEWLDPVSLDAAYISEEQSGSSQALWMAYQQSAWIGQYLVEKFGEEKLGPLLRAFANNSVVTELRMRIVGQAPVDEALREVFGIGQEELFSAALSWIQR